MRFAKRIIDLIYPPACALCGDVLAPGERGCCTSCGKQIDRVKDIYLTAFICSSLDEFDAERNYIGSTSCTIHIVKK